MGPIPLRVALEHSRNLATAHVAATIGMEAIGQTVEKFGIMDHMPRDVFDGARRRRDDAAALTAAYAMLDEGGKRITPTLIDRVQDRNGKTIFRADQRVCRGLRQCRMAPSAGAGDPRTIASRSPIRSPPSSSSR